MYFAGKLVYLIVLPSNQLAITVVYFFITLGRHVSHGERIDPIDFGRQGSKVKVTMDIYGNMLVNTNVTKPLCAS